MKKYIINIKLLSDMCVSDGGVYNSMLDIDVCYDKYGIPYIPAKRLKGCLREAAIELNDWGEDIKIDKIFGNKGSYENAGNMVISNAYIEEYENIISEIIESPGHFLYHPQRILNNYTYIRNQTSIDYETGIADDSSLRSMRVIKKGIEFNAEVQLDEALKSDLEKCVKILTNMGVSRTRGLGEVKATLIDSEKESDQGDDKYVEHAEVIYYELYLKEPVITLSASGLQEKARDYIDGASIMGVVLSRLNSQEKENILKNISKIYFSNAYISQNGRRYTEIPAYISSIKNNHNEFVNNLYYDREKNEGIQINSAKHAFVYMRNDGLEKINVDMEQRYHHRRPDDKSIGKARQRDGGDSDFYQIESINSGQTFSGFITGNPEMIKVIYNTICCSRECRVGYGRSAEYGLANIKITRTESLSTRKKVLTNRFVVKLNSPAIIYNGRAMYSVSTNDLIEEVLSALNVDVEMVDMSNTHKYVNYTSVGGYNVTWNMRKPTLTAFDKGSSIDICLKENKPLELPSILFVGERNTEGYGECEIIVPDAYGQGKGAIVKGDTVNDYIKIDIKSKTLGQMLAKKAMDEYIKELVIDKVSKTRVNEKTKATVSNMILMCKELGSVEKINEAVEKRYSKKTGGKEDKKEIAQSILRTAKEEISKDNFYNQFEDKYGITGEYHDDELYCMTFLKLYLQELKYKARPERIGE